MGALLASLHTPISFFCFMKKKKWLSDGSVQFVAAQYARSLTSIQTVYRTIIEPHFTYCASIIYLCSITDKERLQKLQNRAMRCILRKSRDTPIKRMLDELKWLSVTQACEYYTLILIFKMKCNLLPRYLSINLDYNYELHNRNLRNKGDLKLPQLTKNCSRNNIFYKGVKLYNETTTEMKNCDNLNTFKKLCFEFTRNRPIRENINNS